ncbi:MAG: tyrosine-protein phosphatase [Oscillospiraceae bacterium]|nr:tyrosine-protein phosphatase [Oscillospiraceae bacterium]
MASLLQSTKNTRYLVQGCEKYIRSDAPINLTKEDIQWLKSHGVFTIVDLRSHEERTRKVCPLEGRPEFRYYHLPVTGGNAIPESADGVSESYLRMVDQQMDRILDTIEEAEGNVLYFCSAGKDRTGVVSALLLRRMGVPDQQIIQNYVESAENLRDMLTAFMEAHPERDYSMVIPREAYMEEFLEKLDRLK